MQIIKPTLIATSLCVLFSGVGHAQEQFPIGETAIADECSFNRTCHQGYVKGSDERYTFYSNSKSGAYLMAAFYFYSNELDARAEEEISGVLYENPWAFRP